MNGTPYSEIYELFLAGVRDYKLDKLYQTSPDNLESYLKPFLIRGLINFTNCKKNLENRDDEFDMFNETLSTSEKVILSNLIMIEWLTKEVNDILQMNLHLQDTDFKTFAEANNLKEKRNHLNETIELVDKQMTKYGYININWNTLG
jgi:hypothetical protein